MRATMFRLLLMSSERSGSNLLRAMCDAHPDICAPPAIHFTHGMRHAFKYGDLSTPDARRVVATDLLALARSHPVGWEGLETTPDELVSEAVSPTIWGMVDALMRKRAALDGARHWASKDNQLHEHAFAIMEAVPDVRVITLVRDPRDVVASMLKAPLHPKHELFAAELWAREQSAALRVHQQLSARGHSALLRYEDLVRRPRESLEAAFSVIGLPFHEDMLRHEASEKAERQAKASDYWSNLAKPVQASHAQKYRQSLSPSQIRVVESVTGQLMDSLGYTRDHASTPALRAPARLRARLTDTYQRFWLRGSGDAHIAERKQLVTRLRSNETPPRPWTTPTKD